MSGWINESLKTIFSENGIMEIREMEYELSKFIGIVSVTVNVMYSFCANRSGHEVTTSRKNMITKLLNFKRETRFLNVKCKFKKSLYQVHIGRMDEN